MRSLWRRWWFWPIMFIAVVFGVVPAAYLVFSALFPPTIPKFYLDVSQVLEPDKYYCFSFTIPEEGVYGYNLQVYHSEANIVAWLYKLDKRIDGCLLSVKGGESGVKLVESWHGRNQFKGEIRLEKGEYILLFAQTNGYIGSQQTILTIF